MSFSLSKLDNLDSTAQKKERRSAFKPSAGPRGRARGPTVPAKEQALSEPPPAPVQPEQTESCAYEAAAEADAPPASGAVNGTPARPPLPPEVVSNVGHASEGSGDGAAQAQLKPVAGPPAAPLVPEPRGAGGRGGLLSKLSAGLDRAANASARERKYAPRPQGGMSRLRAAGGEAELEKRGTAEEAQPAPTATPTDKGEAKDGHAGDVLGKEGSTIAPKRKHVSTTDTNQKPKADEEGEATAAGGEGGQGAETRVADVRTKRKYTKRKKEAGEKVEEGDVPVKPKRKYTKRKTVTKTVVDEKTGKEVEVTVPAIRKRMHGLHSTKSSRLTVENISPAERTLRDIIRASLLTDRKQEMARLASAKEAEQEANKQLRNQPKVEPEPESSSMAVAPQVEVVDGKIVVNQNTLMVQARTNEVSGYRRVVEDQPLLNSHSYANWQKPMRWKAAETELFYVALTQFGLDFNLISQLFPTRTRMQIKRKFKAESKINQARIENCVSGKGRDHTQYRKMIAQLKLTTVPEASSPNAAVVADGVGAASEIPSLPDANGSALDAPTEGTPSANLADDNLTATQQADAPFGDDFFDEEEDAYIY